MEDNNVQDENSNYQEEEVLETSNDEGNEDNDSNDLAERLEKAETLANNYKIRAEKAERLAKSAKTVTTPKQTPTAGELSQRDWLYLAKADVHDEDLNEVTNYASKNGITVKEAHEYLKPILAVNAEQRNTANASNTGSSKRGSGKVSDETLLGNASKGTLPDNDADLQRLINARHGYKK